MRGDCSGGREKETSGGCSARDEGAGVKEQAVSKVRLRSTYEEGNKKEAINAPCVDSQLCQMSRGERKKARKRLERIRHQSRRVGQRLELGVRERRWMRKSARRGQSINVNDEAHQITKNRGHGTKSQSQQGDGLRTKERGVWKKKKMCRQPQGGNTTKKKKATGSLFREGRLTVITTKRGGAEKSCEKAGKRGSVDSWQGSGKIPNGKGETRSTSTLTVAGKGQNRR